MTTSPKFDILVWSVMHCGKTFTPPLVICICGTSQAGFPVIKNNAISNCYDIKASHSEQANGRFYTHFSIGVVTRYDSRRRFFCATQYHNTVTLFRMVATLFQHCYAVLSSKSSWWIVSCNITFLGVYQSVVSLIKTFHGAWLRVFCIASAKVLLSH